MMYKTIVLTKSELKTKIASDFNEGDTIEVGKYIIHIEYGSYKTPLLKSWVETTDGKILSSWPIGARGAWPYFIYEFLGRRENAV